MPFIPPEEVARAKEIDLYSYLRANEPQELVHFGGSTSAFGFGDAGSSFTGGSIAAFPRIMATASVKGISFTLIR